MASDIAYWSKEFDVASDRLHEAIRTHGTYVEKIRAPFILTKVLEAAVSTQQC